MPPGVLTSILKKQMVFKEIPSEIRNALEIPNQDKGCKTLPAANIKRKLNW